jgi:hypothetical protein
MRGRPVDLPWLVFVVSCGHERLRSWYEVVVPDSSLPFRRSIGILMFSRRSVRLQCLPVTLLLMLFVRLSLISLECVGSRLTLDGRVYGVTTSV